MKKNKIIIEKIDIHVDMKDEEMIIIVKLNQHHDININQNLKVRIIIGQSAPNIRKMIRQLFLKRVRHHPHHQQ